QPVDRPEGGPALAGGAAKGEQIDAGRVVQADRVDVAEPAVEGALLPGATPDTRPEAVQLAGAVIAEDVVPEDLSAADPGQMAIPDDVAAGSGAARAVAVCDRREDRVVAGQASEQRREGLERRPPQVRSTETALGQVVHLLIA